MHRSLFLLFLLILPCTAWGSSGAMASGGRHSCAITSTSTLSCWGDGDLGQLGNGQAQDSPVPLAVPGLTGITRVAAGDDHTCALKGSTGQLTCFGSNLTGQLGNGNSAPTLFHHVLALNGVKTVSANGRTTCAIVGELDALRCWGANGSGQISSDLQDKLTPFGIATHVASVAVGTEHVCWIRDDGVTVCRGANAFGQLAAGHTMPVAETSMTNIANVVAIEAGGFHTCVETVSSTWCWGRNDFGQLGVGTTSVSPLPKQLLMKVQGISAGLLFTCGLVQNQPHCWGRNDDGQLGIGGDAGIALPTPVMVLNAAQSVAAGSQHACGIDLLGKVHCWGNNEQRQLGIAKVTEPVGVQVHGISDATNVEVGYEYACSSRLDESISCWHPQKAGEPSVPSTAMIEMPPGSPISAGYKHACAIGALDASNRQLFCWGSNESAQIGTGAPSGPVLMPYQHLGNWADVSAGAGHTCAINLHENQLYCWGSNEVVQLGILGGARTLPTPVPGMNSVAQVAAGSTHTCAVKTDNSVWCWGLNTSIQLGVLSNGTEDETAQPLMVPGIQATQVIVGEEHSCALNVGGTVSCWGSNASGQLGVPAGPFDVIPQMVPGLTSIVKLAAGLQHTCALKSDGMILCFGRNSKGQLASGYYSTSELPQPALLPPAVDIAAEYDLTCAIGGLNGSASRVYCAGSGALGNQAPLRAMTPQAVPGLIGMAEQVFANGFE